MLSFEPFDINRHNLLAFLFPEKPIQNVIRYYYYYDNNLPLREAGVELLFDIYRLNILGRDRKIDQKTKTSFYLASRF